MATSGISNLSNLLPSGTFLAFQTLTPIFANNGECGTTERLLTVVLVGIFALMCFGLSFTDSVTSRTGEIFYGIVTKKGLWNPQFRTSGPPTSNSSLYDDRTGKYTINIFDFINGIFNVVLFSTVALLTSPATPCIYPGISPTIVRCIPVLVGLPVTMYFAFVPKARQGVGFGILNCPHDHDDIEHHHSDSSSTKSGKCRELESKCKTGEKSTECRLDTHPSEAKTTQPKLPNSL